MSQDRPVRVELLGLPLEYGNQLEQVQVHLSALLARLEPLMSAWQGDAAGSFQVLKERWSADAKELNAALRGIGEALVANTNNYRTTEEANHSSFTGISAVLG